MSLIQSPTVLAAAQILESVSTARSHYMAAAGLLNGITRTILALPNDDLAAFGNNLGPAEMQALTTAHGAQGDGLNALIAAVDAVLGQSGIPACGVSVDVRPLPEKLADQSREIVLTNGVFSVIDAPVKPITEPATPTE